MVKGEKERIYYIRKMASTIVPSEEEKRDLYNLANNVPFDDRIKYESSFANRRIITIDQIIFSSFVN